MARVQSITQSGILNLIGMLQDAITNGLAAASQARTALENDVNEALVGLDEALSMQALVNGHVIYYNPVTGWSDPDIPSQFFRKFDSMEYIGAPTPPLRERDRWLPHPQAPIYATLGD